MSDHSRSGLARKFSPDLLFQFVVSYLLHGRIHRKSGLKQNKNLDCGPDLGQPIQIPDEKSKKGHCKNLDSWNLESGTTFFAKKKVKKEEKKDYGRHPLSHLSILYVSPQLATQSLETKNFI